MTAKTEQPGTTDTSAVTPAASGAARGVARRLVGAALLSAEPKRLVDFYGAVLGLRFEHRVHPDGREHFINDLEGIHLEVKALVAADGSATSDAVKEVGPSGDVSSIELSYEVVDFDTAFHGAVDLGARVHSEPEDFAWGRFGVVLDPDGNRLGLFAPPSSSSTAQGDQ